MSFENTLSSRQPASVPLPCTRMPTKLLPPSSDVDILEPLGLPLRGFQTNDATPTTAPTSLPTPSSKRLQHVHVFPDQQWLLPPDAERVVEAPGAPLMRDYDSFTEGTAKGSFDSIPIEATDQYGEQLLVLDHETVGTLPIDIGARSTIERWRDVVSQSMDDPPAQHHMPPSAVIGFDDEDFLVTPTKRPHSITSEDGMRRTRHRRHSMTASQLASLRPSAVSPGAFPSARGLGVRGCARSHSVPPHHRVPPP